MNSYLENALREIDKATAGLSDPDLIHVRLAKGKWSAAEILEHLTLAFTSTTRLLRKVAAQPNAVPRSTIRQHLKQMVVVELGYFPSGVQAPTFTRPTGAPLMGIRKRCREALAEMDSVLSECARTYGLKRKIAVHQILGPLTVQQWSKFHLVHTRHHMKQISRMRVPGLRAAA